MKLKIDRTTFDANHTMSLVQIEDKEGIKQVCVDGRTFLRAVRIVAELLRGGMEKVYITVGDKEGDPLIIGGKTIGIALAPSVGEEE